MPEAAQRPGGSGVVPQMSTNDSSACDSGADSLSLDSDQAWQMGSQGCPPLGRRWRTCVCDVSSTLCDLECTLNSQTHND